MSKTKPEHISQFCRLNVGDKIIKLYKPYGGEMAIKIKTIAKLYTNHTPKVFIKLQNYRQILRGGKLWHI